MIKPELYHKTVGILFDAYFNDTLRHGDCQACAVGNIICGNLGSHPLKMYRDTTLYTKKDGSVFNVPWGSYDSDGRAIKRLGVCKLTGYSHKQIDRIETAFETAEFSKSKDEYMFNGLTKVLNCLAEIHQVTDQDLLTANITRFKDHYNKRIGAAV